MQSVKALIVGDAGVGKTSIIEQFSEREFHEQREDLQHDMKLLVNTVLLSDQKTKLVLWDTAGDEE